MEAIDRVEVVADENTEIDLVLEEGGGGEEGVGSISGTVFNGREPVANATVILDGDERREGIETQTDENGAFAYEEVPAGAYTVLAQHGDLSAMEQIRVAADEETVVRLALSEDDEDREIGRVHGVVTTEDEEPAVRAIIHLWQDGRERPVIIARAVTDGEGAFALEAPGGQYHITAELEDVGVAEDDIEVVANENTDVHLVLGDGEIGHQYGVNDEDTIIPVSSLLLESYPNPFNAVATISYNLPAATQVKLSVFTTEGRHIQTLTNGWRMAGEHQVEFNGYSLPTGTYILRLDAGKLTQTTKLQLLK